MSVPSSGCPSPPRFEPPSSRRWAQGLLLRQYICPLSPWARGVDPPLSACPEVRGPTETNAIAGLAGGFILRTDHEEGRSSRGALCGAFPSCAYPSPYGSPLVHDQPQAYDPLVRQMAASQRLLRGACLQGFNDRSVNVSVASSLCISAYAGAIRDRVSPFSAWLLRRRLRYCPNA
jgi:hypothetical protein